MNVFDDTAFTPTDATGDGEGVAVGIGVGEAVGISVGVAVGEAVGEGVGDSVTTGVGDGVGDGDERVAGVLVGATPLLTEELDCDTVSGFTPGEKPVQLLPPSKHSRAITAMSKDHVRR